jgi:hypothetical protein
MSNRKLSVESLEDRSVPASYPSDAGLVNVQSYGATPNDASDDTAAIQAALNAYPSGNRVVYIPDGVYRVSETLIWPLGVGGSQDDQKRVILEGQSRDGTIIQLINNAPAFQSVSAPKPVISTAYNGAAERFRNSIRDLTVDTGIGNEGAIGIAYTANNQGTLRDVRIRSGDGQGVIGLDGSAHLLNGPALIKNVIVEGFQTGIRTRFDVNSWTMEDITLSGQTARGIWNTDQQLNIRRLISTNSNTIPVVYNEQNSKASLVLLDSALTGTGAANPNSRAVWNQAAMYVRNLTTNGYAKSIDNEDKPWAAPPSPDQTNPYVAEWHSHRSTPYTLSGDSLPGSLRLPVLETPVPVSSSFSEWVNAGAYYVPSRDGDDYTRSIQEAINSGAKTIYFPGGRNFKINGTITVNNRVQRFVGLEGNILGTGKFVIAAGASPTVRFDRLDFLYDSVSVENQSARTVILSSVMFRTAPGGGYVDSGTGDLFLEDVHGGNWNFNGGRVYARQLNAEKVDGEKVTNNGAALWIFGLKTEFAGTMIATTGGGSTELHGALLYNTRAGNTAPMFSTVDSSLSVNGVAERNKSGDPLDIWVRQTRVGQTSDLLPADVKDRGSLWFAGYRVPSAPTGLKATSYQSTTMNLSWTRTGTNSSMFEIERATNAAFTQNLATVATVSASITAFIDSNLARDTTYYYRVRATNPAGDSANSTTAIGRTLVFSDLFTSGTSNWTPVGGTWSVQAAHAGRNNVYRQAANVSSTYSLAGSSTLGNYSISAWVNMDTLATNGSIGVIGRYQDGNNYYTLQIASADGINVVWRIQRLRAGLLTTLASGALAYTPGTWRNIRLSMNGSTLTAAQSTNGVSYTTLGTATDTSFATGRFGVRTTWTTGWFDEVRVAMI